MPSRRSSPKYDPFWDLEGPAAQTEWKRRRLRRVQAVLAWIDVAAVSALVLRVLGR